MNARPVSDKGPVLRLRTREDGSSQFLKLAPQFTLSLCHAANCFAEHTNAPLRPQSAFLMHMRIRAGLAANDARAIHEFLQTAN